MAADRPTGRGLETSAGVRRADTAWVDDDEGGGSGVAGGEEAAASHVVMGEAFHEWDEDRLRALIATLGAELRRRDDEYERDHGGLKSCRAIIAADDEWEAAYQRLKRSEMALAWRSRKPGGCAFYIARRRRYCASRAGDGLGGLCSLHAPQLGDDSCPDRREPEGPRAAGACLDAGDPSAAASGSLSVDGRRREQTSSRKTNIHRRMKKMTNPMAAPFRIPVLAPDWSSVYADVTLPMLIDVGCAKGRFLQRAATVDAELFEAKHGKHNLLGLEIYEPLVTEANQWRAAQRRTCRNANRRDDSKGPQDDDDDETVDAPVDNLHFIACNANVSLQGMKPPNVSVVTILFPDPWSRRKHANRRVVTPEFVALLADMLATGAKVYCCSDVRPLSEEMQALFTMHPAFELDEEAFAANGEMNEPEPEPEGVSRNVQDDRGRVEKRQTSPAEASKEAEAAEGEGDGGGGGGGGASQPKKEKGRSSFEHVFPAHQYQWQSPIVALGGADAKAMGGGEGEGEQADDGIYLRGDVRPRWLAANPYTVPTERDLVCESKWRMVYRFVVRRL